MRDAWTKTSEKAVSDHRVLRIRHDRYRFEKTGSERDYVVIEAPAWVNVVAVTSDDRVVLIRQFRHGVGEVTLEIPGGMIDDGESPIDAAARELREETGFVADRIEAIGEVQPNPALQNNLCYTFIAHGAYAAAPPEPDPHEDIEVITAPLSSVPNLIATGTIRHALVVAAFAFAGITRRGAIDD